MTGRPHEMQPYRAFSGSHAAGMLLSLRTARRTAEREIALLAGAAAVAVLIVAAAPLRSYADASAGTEPFLPLKLGQMPATETAPAAVTAEPSAQDIDARARYLMERLDARKKHATWWHRSWFAVYTGGMAFTALRLGITDSSGVRADSIVSGVKSAIGLSNLLFRPLEARHGADRIRAMPGETREQRLARMEAAEKQLEANAARASKARDWRAHLSSVGLNVAGGAALLIGGWQKRAAVSAALGIVVGEISIYTEPVTPAQDWDDYQARKSSRTWTLLPSGNGLTFAMTF